LLPRRLTTPSSNAAVPSTSLRSIDRQVTISLVGVLAILLALSVYARARFTALDTATERVDHTHRVLDGIEKVDRLMSGAQAEERGYLLTGRRAHLSRLHAMSSDVSSELGHLRELTSDNPVQQRRLDTLQSLAAEQLATMHGMVALHDSGGRGGDAAVDAMARDVPEHGELLGSRYREMSGRILHAENDLIAERVTLRAARRQELGIAMLIRALAALLVVLLAAWRVRRALVELGLAERERDAHATELTRQKLELQAQNEALLAQGEALRIAMSQAEAANGAKSTFLAQMSHELRTPLNSVIGFANIVRRNSRGALGPGDVTYLDRIAENGHQLLRTINSILDLSKIEAEQESVDLEMVSLDTMVSEVLGQLEPMAMAGKVSLVPEVPAPLASIVSDAEKFRRVLINLIANAVKFTKPGGRVTVRIVTGTRSPTLPVAIEVRDTGIGIAPERLAAIFEAFEQGDVGVGREFGGTGLGLSISRALCKLLQCELTVSSALGEGSVFRIGLPTGGALASPPLPAHHTASSIHAARV
jgi:signal transduction histidine kinase